MIYLFPGKAKDFFPAGENGGRGGFFCRITRKKTGKRGISS